MPFIVSIRNRRQITLPAGVLEQLGLSMGDSLAIQVEKQQFTAKPMRKQALDTLKAIQKIFQKSKISEKDLQKSGRNLRKKIYQETYGK